MASETTGSDLDNVVATGDGIVEEEVRKSNLEEYKQQVIGDLIRKQIELSDKDIATVFGIEEEKLSQIRSMISEHGTVEKKEKDEDADENQDKDQNNYKDKDEDDDIPWTWDYVMAFRVGKTNEFKKPSQQEIEERKNGGDESNYNSDEWQKGITQRKYFGQIIQYFWQRLEGAGLSVKGYRSLDESLIFLLIGITQKNLNYIASEKRVNLKLDASNAVRYGREKGMILAHKTKMNRNEGDYECPIALSNWSQMHVRLRHNHDNDIDNDHDGIKQDIYCTYPRFIPVKEENKVIWNIFDHKTRLRIIYDTIITKRVESGAEIKVERCIDSKEHPLVGVFPLHNGKLSKILHNQWLRRSQIFNYRSCFWCPLNEIRSYFGESIGFYFAFLQFYMKSLKIPSIIGLLFFFLQLVFDVIDAPGVFAISFIMIFWSVWFVEKWKRYESNLILKWGMTKFRDDRNIVTRSQFVGEWILSTVDGLWEESYPVFIYNVKTVIVSVLVLICTGASVFCTVFVLLYEDNDPENDDLQLILAVISSILVYIFDYVYNNFNSTFSEWENHKTQEKYENSYLSKLFFFKFFNDFSTLFYLAFIRPVWYGDDYYVKYYSSVNNIDANGFQCHCDNSFVATGYCLADLGGSSFNVDTNECAGIGTVSGEDMPTNTWSYCTDGYMYQNSTGSNLVDVNGECNYEDVQLAINETVLSELRIQLATLFLTKIIFQNGTEILKPWMYRLYNKFWTRRYGLRNNDSKQLKVIQNISTEKNSGNSNIDNSNINVNTAEESDAEKQLRLETYTHTIDNFSEIVIQYGYVTFFVMALPISPLFAIVNNIIEMKKDGYILLHERQRPYPKGAYGIGAWNNILNLFLFVCVITNLALLTWRTSNVESISNIAGSEYECEFKWLFFTLMIFVLTCIMGFEKWCVNIMPSQVEADIKRQHHIESILINDQKVEQDETSLSPSKDVDGMAFDPSKDAIDVDLLDIIPTKNIHLSKKCYNYQNQNKQV